jgi:hypothetical protein
MGIFDVFFSSKPQNTQAVENKPVSQKVAVYSAPPKDIPNTRKSAPPENINKVLENLGKDYKVISPETLVEFIPVIRKIVKLNPDLSQAINNIVALGNTGHKVYFDRGVSEDQQEKMRRHLHSKGDSWASGSAGIEGVVNKMLYQIMIGGALSVEWVPDIDLTTIESVVFPQVETIRFVLNGRKTKYLPHQKMKWSATTTEPTLRKLNENTYRYYALNGDEEVPYGTPPYVAALKPLSRQKKILENLDFVIDQLGIFGFLQVLVQKPDQQDNESDEKYVERLKAYLKEAALGVGQGFKDGAVVGYKEDHEFEFTSIAKDFEKIAAIFQENELQIASATKQDAALWGRGYSTSETQITVVFMKMLSELRNIQNIVACALQFGYALELRLAGFNFQSLTVKFNPSTIQDDLKIQQAEEIKVRNGIQKYLMGTISEEQFADELGYEVPDQPSPRVPVEILAGGKNPAEQAEKDQKREKKKDASDKKVRDKNKPVGKTK